ncbi:MAG: hypothetical protein LBJ35_05620, partial [Spirochaetaceae bacterium]|nr:hypothetical protein [Spirochaetaceae bacterium]
RETGTLSTWCAEHFPEFLSVRGRKALEGGLLHRLDYETRGLVFAALTQRVMDNMTRQQEDGLFIKEYEAIAGAGEGEPIRGFPPRPFDENFASLATRGFYVDSGFRYYGKGRKSVRPVIPCCAAASNQNTRVYRTEIVGADKEKENFWRIHARLTRGFRHQIRCHLAWLGLPIRGDILYGGRGGGPAFALRAIALKFADPLSGTPRYIQYHDNELKPPPPERPAADRVVR